MFPLRFLSITSCLFMLTSQAWGGNPSWRVPADTAAQEALWLSWPVDEPKVELGASDAHLAVIRATQGHVKVQLLVDNLLQERQVRDLAKSHKITLDHVHFLHLPRASIWVRDWGPQFVRSSTGQVAIADWDFNQWGFEEPTSELSRLEENVHRLAAEALGLGLRQVPRHEGQRLIHEGGSSEHNGAGTMIAVESVVMQRALGPRRFCGGRPLRDDPNSLTTYAEHPGWKSCRRRVEQVYRDVLGAQKVIWLPTGLVEDDGSYRGPIAEALKVSSLNGAPVANAGALTMMTTNGHADEFVRFVAEDLVALIDPHEDDFDELDPVLRPMAEMIQTINKRRMESALAILEQSTTVEGKPLRIVRVPAPKMTFETIEPSDMLYASLLPFAHLTAPPAAGAKLLTVLPASYLNYVVTNDLVFVPSYWRPGVSKAVQRRDQKATDVLQELFPDRQMVSVRGDIVNIGGGGLHCMTQQQPLSRF